MRKIVSILIIAVMLVSAFAVTTSAATVTVVTPVEMSYVGVENGNYEYNVKATVNVKESGIACQDEISIIMFGNKDNSAFVLGDSVVNLTVDSITSNYHIYYIDQKTSGANGVATFNFNVILPEPASSDKYYIWAGSKTSTDPDKAEGNEIGVNTLPVGVSISVNKTAVDAGDDIVINPSYSNIFGNSIENGTASVDYVITKDGMAVNGVVVDNVINTSTLNGVYKVKSVLTNSVGQSVTSNEVTFSVIPGAADGEYRKGDVDGDSKVSTYDAIKVLTYISGIGTIDDKGLTSGNVDGVAGLSGADATLILKYIARIIYSF